MRDFFETSVLVATFWEDHPQHEANLRLFAQATRETAACGVHSFAEVYAVMTALPVRPRLEPAQVMLFLEEMQQRLAVVTPTEAEYLETARDMASLGLVSGRIYDALLLRCARKVAAQNIHTWNIRHFRALAPDLLYLVLTPP